MRRAHQHIVRSGVPSIRLELSSCLPFEQKDVGRRMSLTSEHEKMLATEMTGWLTTVHGDQPQSSPVGYLWSAGSLWIRSEPQQLKVRNISQHPLASFHLDQRGRHVVSLECRAVRVEQFPASVRASYGEKYEAAAAAAGSSLDEQEARFSACLRLDPTRIRSW